MTESWAWDVLVWVIGPVLFLGLAAYGLLRRGRVGPWVPAVGCLPLVAFLIECWLPPQSADHGFTVFLTVWFLATIVCLTLAIAALVRNWPGRSALVLVGLCLPTPLMALFLVYVIEDLVAYVAT